MLCSSWVKTSGFSGPWTDSWCWYNSSSCPVSLLSSLSFKICFQAALHLNHITVNFEYRRWTLHKLPLAQFFRPTDVVVGRLFYCVKYVFAAGRHPICMYCAWVECDIVPGFNCSWLPICALGMYRMPALNLALAKYWPISKYFGSVWFKLTVMVTQMTINGNKSNPLTVTVTEKFH